jgi:hypothetical protein
VFREHQPDACQNEVSRAWAFRDDQHAARREYAFWFQGTFETNASSLLKLLNRAGVLARGFAPFTVAKQLLWGRRIFNVPNLPLIDCAFLGGALLRER